MHLLYKIGFALVVILFLFLVPMFIFLKEMAVLLAINTAIIGIFTIIAYFLIVLIYLKYGRLRTLISILIVVSIFTGFYLFFEWRDQQIFHEFYDLSIAVPVEINQTITDKEQTEDTIVWEKYSFTIPEDGNIEVKVLSEHTAEELGLTLIDKQGNHVGFINESRGLTLEEAIRGETYYLLLDKRKNSYSVQLKLHRK